MENERGIGAAFDADFCPEDSQFIYIKEIFAAVKTAERWAQKDKHLILGMDSLTAMGILRKGAHVQDPLVRKLLLDWHEITRVRKCHITLVYVNTKDNFADSSTRGVKNDRRRFEESMKILSGEYMYTFNKDIPNEKEKVDKIVEDIFAFEKDLKADEEGMDRIANEFAEDDRREDEEEGQVPVFIDLNEI